jgi:hypothetical protein
MGSTRIAQSRFDIASLLAVITLLGLFAVRQVGSPDAGFHLATGQSILEERGWPRTDPFTYTVNDHPYIDTSWGYDVLLALFDRAFGVSGLVFLHVAFVIAIFSLLAATARLTRGDPRTLGLLLLLGGLASESRFEVRPELLSYVFLALAAYLLHRRAEGLRSRLWILVPLFWVWSNSHSLFVIGWGLLACFNVGTSVAARRIDRSLLGWSIAAVATAILTPYGWAGLRQSLILFTRMQGGHLFGENIGEYESPWETLSSGQLGFYLVPMICLFLFVGIVLVSIVPLWKQRRIRCVLLGLVFVPLALTMVRNAPLLVVTCLPGAAWALPLPRVLAALKLTAPVRHTLLRTVPIIVLLFAITMGLRVYNDAYYMQRRRLERFGTGWNRLRVPVEAAAWARNADLPGRMLNTLGSGGYLMWALSEPVFIDGRLEVIGEDFFREYQRTLGSLDAVEESVSRYDIGWMIFPYRDRPDVLQAVSQAPRWRLAYIDDQAVVFVRTNRTSEGIVDDSVRRAHAPSPALELATVPGLGAPRPGRGRRWLSGLVRRQTYPVSSYSLAVFHYLRGDWHRFAAYSADAIRESRGAYFELYSNLGSGLEALGQLHDARRCYVIALAEVPIYKSERMRTLRQAIAAIDQRTRLP